MKRRKRMAWISLLAAAIAAAAGLVCLWIYTTEQNAHYTPGYPREDITSYLEKDILTAGDYDILYHQTGLSRAAVDALLGEERENDLFAVQDHFFEEVNIDCECHLFVYREELAEADSGERSVPVWTAVFPAVEDGDILITFNSHFLGWRNGHAGIVIDAEKGLTLEALTLGRDSAILSLDSWAERPSFAVLRLRDTTERQRAEIAAYAREHLTEVPYHLTAGIWEHARAGMPGMASLVGKEVMDVAASDPKQVPSGTQCAHLVWYAYRHFGYDLDSDGGLIVTPMDLYDSPLLEIVQIYGMRIN